MQIIFYFLTLFVLLELSARALCGWHASTRGYLNKYPDGSDKKDGFIFKSWYFFWFKQHEEKLHMMYKGDGLALLIQKLKRDTGINIMTLSPDRYYFETVAEFINFIPQLNAAYNVIIAHSIAANGAMKINVMGIEPNYIFPEWLRTIMAGCITCYASLYGSIVFFAFNFLFHISGVELFGYVGTFYDYIYGWIIYKTALMLFTWIIYTFSLAYLTTVKWKKTNL